MKLTVYFLFFFFLGLMPLSCLKMYIKRLYTYISTEGFGKGVKYQIFFKIKDC